MASVEGGCPGLELCVPARRFMSVYIKLRSIHLTEPAKKCNKFGLFIAVTILGKQVEISGGELVHFV